MLLAKTHQVPLASWADLGLGGVLEPNLIRLGRHARFRLGINGWLHRLSELLLLLSEQLLGLVELLGGGDHRLRSVCASAHALELAHLQGQQVRLARLLLPRLILSVLLLLVLKSEICCLLIVLQHLPIKPCFFVLEGGLLHRTADGGAHRPELCPLSTTACTRPLQWDLAWSKLLLVGFQRGSSSRLIGPRQVHILGAFYRP